MEDQKDQKIRTSTAAPTDPVYAIEQWREALQEMPEWDSLPDEYHAAILRKLKSRQFPPSEPSSHTSWKHVKAMLQQGKQPDWIHLITATFIWRVKRRRPGMIMTTAMPDMFMTEAAFHTPPINITNWPTKGMTAAWQPKEELIPQSGVKIEDSAQNTPPPGLWAPKAPAAREATVAREAPAVREPSAAPSAAPSARSMPPPVSRSTGQKRARTEDQEDTTNRPAKRRNTTSGIEDETTAGTNDLDEWKKKLAASDDKLADLIKELAETKTDLTDTTRKLADTTKNLENTSVELGELRAIAMGNRRYLRRIVAGLAASARVQEHLAGQVLQDNEVLAENMG
ncbi:hypothetical protein CONLIGDRAFT_671475 [Coniochaeta ligniaria NRRL 30616]|uniref:Uncharacterized protein n=1 Tax=Coniochaeta ligniaria NRRL 30616 TaxID=1408157 RepID=A0A1J7IKE5_9PEZI|nr:hypothetical protein CONLIGDRAFT_671475 [Coniochaeta ligniaria NRRL 30616]